ncbi:alpha/beta hydrolase family protein [Cohnella sp. GCM10012308]|uniref:alpha/beta hydrolase family protein n=1 Tax=Cohnella sp. GCM10012308 TaxID=3317329 RepID=UPI003612B271
MLLPQALERTIFTLYDTQDQLKRHVYERADRAFARGDRERDRISTASALRERQLAMKTAFIHAIGGIPDREAEMNAVIVGQVREEGYRIENIVYEPLPGYRVTSNLYLPAQAEPASPSPVVLFLSGHEPEGRHSDYYHRVILRFVEEGLAVFAFDPPGQGERVGEALDDAGDRIWGTGEHQRIGVRCYPFGESIARYFVMDAIRAIDYLETRPELDTARLGVTGNSGGGTQTAMMMLCDERISAAAPATFIMDRQSYMYAGGVQDAEQVWPGLTEAGFDHEDLLLAFAPKPLLVLAAEYDFFPIEGTRRTVTRSRRYWEMLGKEADFECYVEPSLHRYTDGMAKKAAAFFAQRLLAHPRDSAGHALPAVPTDKLWCTKQGRMTSEWPQALTLSDIVQRRYERFRSNNPGRPSDALAPDGEQWLRDQVYAGRAPCPFNTRHMRMADTDGLSTAYWMWWSQSGVMNSALWFGGAREADDRPAEVVMAAWAGGTNCLSRHWPWILEQCAAGRSVVVLNASGVGPHEPAPVYGQPVREMFGMLHKLADELIWLGDSLAALRTYDTIRCAEWITSVAGNASLSVYAPGNAWLSARLAALLCDRIGQVYSDTEYARLADWFLSAGEPNEDWMSAVFPGLLQYVDIAGPTTRE